MLLDVLRHPTTMTRLALASVVANTAIVVTGGIVRLTGSGLGCPTWPRCTDATYTPTAAYSWHGLVEFGNRMLTFALTLVVVAALVVAYLQRQDGRPRRDLRRLAVAVFLGIPAQAVLGGITVLTGLNPWTVMAHFLLSMVLVALAVLLWQRSRGTDTPARVRVRPELLLLGRSLVVVTGLVLAFGTVVTGSGPHAGDATAHRTGFDPATVSQLHADAVMLLVGMTVATWLALRATAASAEVVRAALVLLAVELAQGVVGYLQYFTGLPSGLVAVHLLGACVVWVAALRLWLSLRERPAAASVEPLAADRAAVLTA